MISDMDGILCCFAHNPTVTVPVIVVAAGEKDFGNV